MSNSPLPSPLPVGEGARTKSRMGFFITGTDTGVGKTRISLGVMRALQQQGLRVVGMKPVASGCESTAEGLRNEDALLLRHHASAEYAYDIINPYAFAPAIAPHIAARRSGRTIELSPIVDRFNQLTAASDCVVVEGAGGWLVPLNERETIADLAVVFGLPVILVAAIRLGCINHTLLSARAIRASGCRLAGWIANHVNPPDDEADEIGKSIAERIEAPLLGRIDYQKVLNVDELGRSLDLAALMKSCES